jgi:uncharacterized membrane protein
MPKGLRLFSWLDRLRSTYWFVPAIITCTAAGLGAVLVAVDRSTESPLLVGWAYGGGADGARSLLSAIAGSTITVVSVTFSVLVVALTVSSQHFGPRLLNSFMRDTSAQLVLGTFTGVFAYCLVVLRTVQGDGGGGAVFIPHLAVTGAVILTLFSVGMLIYYVHHVAMRMQISEITQAISSDLESAIERLYPEQLGEDSDASERPPDEPVAAMRISARRSGYIQEINSDTVVGLAVKHETTIWLIRRPGDFVIEGATIAAAHPLPARADRLPEALAKAYVIGADRTSHQDAAFAVQQLVEVGMRALSPGVNEPFTALTCIDRLGQGLARLLTRRIPGPVRKDRKGHPRIIASARTFEELVTAAFEPLAIYAERNPAITARILETLNELAARARRPADRRSIADLADFVWQVGAKQVPEQRHRSELRALHHAVIDEVNREGLRASAR